MRGFLLSLTYARRELRAGLKGLYVFVACLALGVAAIAAVQSLSHGLGESLQRDGRVILGGDIALRTVYTPAPPEQVKFLREKVGPVSAVIETRAMARTADERTTLVELKAVDPFYPLYGRITVDGYAGPLQNLLLPQTPDGDDWGALVEKEVLTRLDLKLGDIVQVGDKKFILRGVISAEPDRVGSMRFSLAPRLMISGAAFADTGLSGVGAQVYYDYRVVLPGARSFDDVRAAKTRIEAAFPGAAWRGRDFLSAAPQMERMIGRLTLFLTLIGLSTLLIGGVGVSNAVRGVLDSRAAHIATLKCLGASEPFIFRVYLLMILALSLLGVALGLVLGAGGARVAQVFLTARLALSDQAALYPGALALAGGFGLLTALSFSLWSLGRAARVPATALFRDLVSPAPGRPALSIIISIIICAQALALLAVLSASEQWIVVWFSAAALGVFAVFRGYAWGVSTLAARIRAVRRPTMRLALANLHRPGNLTASVVLSLGVGLTVLVAAALVQSGFIRLLRDDMAADAPSFFFLDIAPGQQDAFRDLVTSFPTARGLVMTPSLRGRIVRVNGRRAEEMLVDKNESWVVNADRGFTYAAALPAHSNIVAGQWWAENYSGPPLVSIATNVARAFNIGPGAELTVNILGGDVTATVANVREVDWSSFTMNFAVTFSPGVLENAPANYLATVIVDKSREEELQTAVSRAFRAVTSVRVGDALAQAQVFVRAIGQAVALAASVTLVAGTLVLAGGIAAARRRHAYDAVVLKVLGATRARILSVFLVEYGLLGALTALLAAVLGTVCAYAVQVYALRLRWTFDPAALALVTAFCLVVTLAAGIFGALRALREKPAAYLRNE